MVVIEKNEAGFTITQDAIIFPEFSEKYQYLLVNSIIDKTNTLKMGILNSIEEEKTKIYEI